MPRILINLAFDHELSLGGVSGSYRQNLFEPTLDVLQLADDLAVKVTLFTDVLCSLRFNEQGQHGFVENYEQQIRHACEAGHDVQLHLHPHWQLTDISEHGFDPSPRYRLHDFRDDSAPDNISGIVARSVRYLREICGEARSDYECVAYRAGGLSISPSTREIVAALWRNGIRIDSSIAPGYRFRSTLNSVDFTAAPMIPNWYFREDVCDSLDPRANRELLFEVPIATAPRNPINNLPALCRRLVFRARRPMTGGVPLTETNTGPIDKLKRLFPFSSWFLSFDYWWSSGEFLVSVLCQYLRRFDSAPPGDIIVSSLSHPKSMGPGGLAVMREFIDLARREFGDDIEFVTFPDINATINSASAPAGDRLAGSRSSV